MSTGRAALFENLKPRNLSTGDWCIPEDKEEGDYLILDPACEVKAKGNREKNEINEALEKGTEPPLELDPNEISEADEENLPYPKENWENPEPKEFP